MLLGCAACRMCQKFGCRGSRLVVVGPRHGHGSGLGANGQVLLPRVGTDRGGRLTVDGQNQPPNVEYCADARLGIGYGWFCISCLLKTAFHLLVILPSFVFFPILLLFLTVCCFFWAGVLASGPTAACDSQPAHLPVGLPAGEFRQMRGARRSDGIHHRPPPSYSARVRLRSPSAMGETESREAGPVSISLYGEELSRLEIPTWCTCRCFSFLRALKD
jgi:hypothetical protein